MNTEHGSSSVTNFEGLLLIDKPSGCTSHDVVDNVRRKLKMKRIGHAGTLDPLATGLLIILVGAATKSSQFLMSLDKEYEATLKLGESTDSHDSDGTVTEVRAVPTISQEEVQAEMVKFVGDQFQVPPMFSAKKVQGVPLYKLARQGKTIEREPRFITVYNFDLLSFELPELRFRLKCSKGTYVRTIAHDLGEKIGAGGHLTQLRRTMIGDFDVKNAVTVDKLEELTFAEIRKILIPCAQAIPTQVQ